MQKTIDSLLEKWRLKHMNREYLNNLESDRIQSLKYSIERSKKDQFSWLDVKSQS